MFPFIWLTTKNTVGSVGAPTRGVKLVLGHGDVAFGVTQPISPQRATGWRSTLAPDLQYTGL